MLKRLNLQALGDPRNFWPITTSLIIHALFLALVTMPRAPRVLEFITIDMNALPSFAPPAGGSKLEVPAQRAAAPAPKAVVVPKPAMKQPEMAIPSKQAKPVESVQPAVVASSATASSAVAGGVSGGRGTAAGVSAGGSGSAGPGVGRGPIDGSFGNANGPAFTNMVRPTYPRIARKLGREGVVKLRLTIDDKGKLLSVKVVEKAGHGFDEAAVNAVKESKFRPAKQRGIPVACRALWKVKFALAD